MPASGEPTIDATLQQLLRAASQTISRRGIAATRVSDIAERARVSPATVHYYFKTKQEILIQALLWANENSTALADLADSDTANPLAQLARLLERSIPYNGIQRDEYLLEIDLWSCVRLHSRLLPAWERYHHHWIMSVTAIIRSGVESGVFQTNRPAEDVAECIVALTDGLSAQSAIGASRMPASRVKELVMAFAADQLHLRPEDLDHTTKEPLQVRATRGRVGRA